MGIDILLARDRKQGSKKSRSFDFWDFEKMGLVNSFVGEFLHTRKEQMKMERVIELV